MWRTWYPPDCLCGYGGWREVLMLIWIRLFTWESMSWRALYVIAHKRTIQGDFKWLLPLLKKPTM